MSKDRFNATSFKPRPEAPIAVILRVCVTEGRTLDASTQVPLQQVGAAAQEAACVTGISGDSGVGGRGPHLEEHWSSEALHGTDEGIGVKAEYTAQSRSNQ